MPDNAQPEVRVEMLAGNGDTVSILKVSGPLIIRNFFEFQDRARGTSAKVLIIDLADVPYMDSAALGSLLGVHVSCGKSGRKYGLINVPERLLTMFTVCGVRDVLVTFPNLAEAERALV